MMLFVKSITAILSINTFINHTHSLRWVSVT